MNDFNDLKDEAKLLGIKVGNKSYETLYDEVKAFKAKPSTEVSEGQKRKEAYLESCKLIRVIITPNQAEKANLTWEEFLVHSKYIGDVHCIVPMGDEYHIPKCVLDFIKTKVYTKTIPPKGMNDKPSTQLLPMYNVNILDPLTEEELENIRKGIAAQGNAA